MRDDSGTRNSNFFREFFASGPAIHNCTHPENEYTEYSSQDSGPKVFLNGILHIHEDTRRVGGNQKLQSE